MIFIRKHQQEERSHKDSIHEAVAGKTSATIKRHSDPNASKGDRDAKVQRTDNNMSEAAGTLTENQSYTQSRLCTEWANHLPSRANPGASSIDTNAITGSVCDDIAMRASAENAKMRQQIPPPPYMCSFPSAENIYADQTGMRGTSMKSMSIPIGPRSKDVGGNGDPRDILGDRDGCSGASTILDARAFLHEIDGSATRDNVAGAGSGSAAEAAKNRAKPSFDVDVWKCVICRDLSLRIKSFSELLKHHDDCANEKKRKLLDHGECAKKKRKTKNGCQFQQHSQQQRMTSFASADSNCTSGSFNNGNMPNIAMTPSCPTHRETVPGGSDQTCALLRDRLFSPTQVSLLFPCRQRGFNNQDDDVSLSFQSNPHDWSRSMSPLPI